mmetsp:Transcript_38628/g.97056  ORF Transcript_38628/g.97056 Transcript_38628/m.97056 type:complete len:224 (+) Transcript_38628:697-1368(+)
MTSSCSRFHSSLVASSSMRFRSHSSSLRLKTKTSLASGSASAFSFSRSLRISSSCSSADLTCVAKCRFSSSRRPNWPSFVMARCSVRTSACSRRTSRCSFPRRRWSSSTSRRRALASRSKRARSASSSCRRFSSRSRRRPRSELSEGKSAREGGSEPAGESREAMARRCSWYFLFSAARISACFSSWSNRFFNVSTSSTRSARARSASPERSPTFWRSSLASF